RQILREPFLCSINVADFNADGMLDLVLGTYESPDNPETDMIVYYGTPSGFDESHRQKVHVPSRSFGLAIADYDRDRWLDLAIVGYANDLVTLYRGGPDGFTDQRKRTLRYPAPIELETADLNADGWLDLVVSSYYDPVTQKRDTGLSIFWGDPRGWTLDNSQWLPGLSAQAMGVADLDRDGFLDLVLPNYHGELTREHLPSYIYWGSAAGYSTRQRTLLTVDSAVDVMIADYDGDGRLDLAFTAHSVDAGHRVSSPVYFNDGRRFESPRVQYLPVIGPFYSWEQDPGNIYTRRFEEEFTSRVLAWSAPAGRGSIRVDAATPFGSQAEVQVRSAPDAAALEKAAWRAVDAGRFTLGAADRALQYRLLLKSANGDAYPVVRQVDVGVE
ncbi:MAG: VCBS repeat-containing protein, partial [Opitutaceae bacterium]|nr:VCBS repeat-containing protein [Opitutaceae bacterium]